MSKKFSSHSNHAFTKLYMVQTTNFLSLITIKVIETYLLLNDEFLIFPEILMENYTCMI